MNLTNEQREGIITLATKHIGSPILRAQTENEIRAIFVAPVAAAPQAPVADAACAEPVNLEGLREKLMAPRNIVRDAGGWLTHPDFPVLDEDVRADKFLESFRIEAAFISMESELPDLAERWCDEGLMDCSEWTPTPPTGEGWVLLSIYDTEDGPYALFGRDQYETEQARKRKHTLDLREQVRALREGRATSPTQHPARASEAGEAMTSDLTKEAVFETWYESRFRPAMERGPFDKYVARQAWFAALLAAPAQQAVTLTDPAVEAFLAEVRAELMRARAKFPGDHIMTIALAEEFGELCKAVLDESAANVRKEAVQTAVMCARVVLDGDGSVNDWRTEKGLDPLVETANG